LRILRAAAAAEIWMSKNHQFCLLSLAQFAAALLIAFSGLVKRPLLMLEAK
jgi:hypothetical protein